MGVAGCHRHTNQVACFDGKTHPPPHTFRIDMYQGDQDHVGYGKHSA